MDYSVPWQTADINGKLCICALECLIECDSCVSAEKMLIGESDIWLHLNEVIAVTFVYCSRAEKIFIIHSSRRCDTVCGCVCDHAWYACLPPLAWLNWTFAKPAHCCCCCCTFLQSLLISFKLHVHRGERLVWQSDISHWATWATGIQVLSGICR